MVRLSKFGVGFVIFMVVGVVKCGLKEVGFIIEKCKGFGCKCDMLIGIFIDVLILWIY